MDKYPPSLIACARMYSVNAEARQLWDRLLQHVKDISGIPLEIIHHAHPTPIVDLWSRPDMGCVQMCGLPIALADVKPALLAVPVLAPARYEGRPVYATDFLVNKESKFNTLEDTFGGRICWTVTNSQSGFNAVRHHLLQYRTPERPELYSDAVGPIGTFSVGMERLLKDEVDVVPIDSYSCDLLYSFDPQFMKNFRVVASTQNTPAPAFVANHGTNPNVTARLSSALLDIHNRPEMHGTLEALLISHFVNVTTDDYDVLLFMAADADSAGYREPA